MARRLAFACCARGTKGSRRRRFRIWRRFADEEAAAAAKLLGAEVMTGEFSDGELADTTEARRKLIAIYRQFRPTLVLAHALERLSSGSSRGWRLLAEAASWFCASGGYMPEQPRRSQTQPELWWMDTINMVGFEPGFFVDVSRISPSSSSKCCTATKASLPAGKIAIFRRWKK